MRRRLPPEPLSVCADWSRRIAAFALLLALFAVMLGRVGVVGGWGGVAVLAVALALALAALGFAATAMVVIWQTGRRGLGRALAGSLLAGVVLAYPLFLLFQAGSRPAIADVSTDLAAPPSFSATAAALTARGGFRHEDPAPAVRDLQRHAYPSVQPILLDLPVDEAYRLVLKTVEAHRWRVVETVPPKGRFGVGHIDAVAVSLVMGFPSDVAIRLRPQEGQTRVDVRSASRLERHDVGENAARIEGLAEELLNAE